MGAATLRSSEPFHRLQFDLIAGPNDTYNIAFTCLYSFQLIYKKPNAKSKIDQSRFRPRNIVSIRQVASLSVAEVIVISVGIRGLEQHCGHVKAKLPKEKPRGSMEL